MPSDEEKPGNPYEEFLWDLADGPVPLGRMFLLWIALVVVVLLLVGRATDLTDGALSAVGAGVSLPYFGVVCPLWASRIGQSRRNQ